MNEPCTNCGKALDAGRSTCPFCRAPRGALVSASASALARADGAGGAIEVGLARVMTESLLAKDEDAEENFLMRELEVQGPLAPAELGAALARAVEADPSLDQLEDLLAKDATDIVVEGIQLASLVDRSGDDLKVLRRGLTFLKHRQYANALEWWTLHRQQLDPSRRRFDLLLLMMEAFTHSLAHDVDAATRTRKRIREHPEFAVLRPKKKT